MLKDWQQWKYHYRDQIAHVAGFEERFVDTVLSKISCIQPDDVIPQYHFIDKKGRNRKIDFMIKNEEKGFLLAIELDGLWKTQNYKEFNDMLERQNSLIDSFGIVLRYTNKKMIYESQEIIDEIYDVLNKQASKKSTDQIRDAHAQKLLQNYEQEIEKLKQQNATSQQLQETLGELQSRLVTLQSKMDHQKNEVSKIVTDTLLAEKQDRRDSSVSKKNNIYGYVLGGIVFCVILVAVFYYNKTMSKDDNISLVNQQTTMTSNTLESEKKSINQFNNPYLSDNEVVTSNNTDPKVEQQVQKVANVAEKEKVAKSQLDTSQVENKAKTEESCGVVVQYKKFARGTYLNLDKPYPNQKITIVVWDHEPSEVEHFSKRRVCVNQSVTYYNGKAQLEVRNLGKIKIVN